MEFLIILTVAAGARQNTWTGTVEVNGPATREDILDWAKTRLPAGFERSVVLFFSAEPNAIGP